jgi:hypothetical protein
MPGQIPVDAAPAVPTWVSSAVHVTSAPSLADDSTDEDWMALSSRYRCSAIRSLHCRSNERSCRLCLRAGLRRLVPQRRHCTFIRGFETDDQILFAVLATHLLTLLHLGWGWLLIVLAACSSYYSLSISRTRARARDDIQRELVKTRLVTEVESADFINSFLDRFWLM